MVSETDWQGLLSTMLHAAAGSLQQGWNLVGPYAINEFTKFQYDLQMIARLKDEGKITEEQAQLHVQMQKNSIRSVLLAVEGIGLLAAEQAVNAALAAVKDAVNLAIGFSVIV